MNAKKFYIIGQGLAGTVLAHKFEQHSINFEIHNVYDPQRTSSWVAGGLFNPVTGKRIQKTWMADVLFEHLFDLYPALESKLGCSFFHPLRMFRIFDSIKAQNEGLSKVSSDDLQPYTSINAYKRSNFAMPVKDDLGSLEIHRAGFLDTRTFLEASRLFFLNLGLLKETAFTADIIPDDETIILWCNGYNHAFEPPYAHAFKPVKGEVLIIELPDIEIQHIILGHGIFVVPLKNGKYRLGATYDWNISEVVPTEAAAMELIRKFYALLGFETEVVVCAHEAGIRPATRDRRPLIGPVKDRPGHYIFNGFGSKGVSLIPYFSEVLLNHILQGKPIPAEVNPDRFNN